MRNLFLRFAVALRHKKPMWRKQDSRGVFLPEKRSYYSQQEF
jgi:hypothetical protein